MPVRICQLGSSVDSKMDTSLWYHIIGRHRSLGFVKVQIQAVNGHYTFPVPVLPPKFSFQIGKAY